MRYDNENLTLEQICFFFTGNIDEEGMRSAISDQCSNCMNEKGSRVCKLYAEIPDDLYFGRKRCEKFKGPLYKTFKVYLENKEKISPGFTDKFNELFVARGKSSRV